MQNKDNKKQNRDIFACQFYLYGILFTTWNDRAYKQSENHGQSAVPVPSGIPAGTESPVSGEKAGNLDFEASNHTGHNQDRHSVNCTEKAAFLWEWNCARFQFGLWC